MIYVVGNEVSPVVLPNSGLAVGIFPKIHGGGYFSVNGGKYPIPYPRKQQGLLLTN